MGPKQGTGFLCKQDLSRTVIAWALYPSLLVFIVLFSIRSLLHNLQVPRYVQSTNAIPAQGYFMVYFVLNAFCLSSTSGLYVDGFHLLKVFVS